MKALAIGHRVVVKPLSLDEVDPARARAKTYDIYIPETSDRKLQTGIDRGKVIDIGPTAFIALNPHDYNIPWCKVGDTIAYARNAGKMVRLSEELEDYVLIINDEDVVTVLEE